MPTATDNRAAATPDFHFYVLALLGGLLVIRLAALFISPYNLHGDEAQYWAWSKELNWGYFTKPPGIAAVIAATTSIFGDAEWAVRLSSPILHTVTAYLIYTTAKFAFSSAAGFWAAAIYMLTPAVWISSAIVSTDVALLLCWTAALNAWVHMRETPNWARATQMGIAIGLGILCKYAMLFFFPALILAVIFDAATRRAILSIKGLWILALIAALITPNILWNLEHDFATLSHTAANANVQEGLPIHPLELLEFLGSQFAAFGPVSLGLFILAVRAAAKNRLESPAIILSFFALSPFLIIAVQAFISRANANWAVTGYIATSILTAHYCVKFWPDLKNWLRNNLIIQTAFCAVVGSLYLMPSVVNAAGRANDVKRLRAWPETVDVIADHYNAGHEGRNFRAVAMDKRIHFYDLTYYGLGETAPLYMWMYKNHPENHAELKYPLPAGDEPVLIVNYYGDEKYQSALGEDFDRLVELPPLDIDLGGGKRRQLQLWAGYGYKPTKTRH